jgi:hypothetical protein
VLETGGFVCHYCGTSGDEWSLVAEHKIPASRGGVDAEQNLVAACVSCNQKKGTRSYEDFVAGKPKPLKARLVVEIDADLIRRLQMDRLATRRPVNQIVEEVLARHYAGDLLPAGFGAAGDVDESR